MSKSILYRMASGIAGAISRMQSSIVESVILNALLPFTAYGVVGKIVSGKFVPLVANDTAAVIYGFYVRPYPTSGSDAAGITPQPGGVGNVMTMGYMTVINNAGTPAIDGQVYIRVANADSTHPLGGVEATFSTATTGAAVGGNTGNGTIGTLSSTSAAQAGVYKATMTAATAFAVTAPDGTQLKAGATGAAYTAGGVTFTITVGVTPMIAGDAFNITVAPNTVALPTAVFTSLADANNNVEIKFKL